MKYKLSEIMDLIGGGTPKTSVPEYWGGDIPWLSVKDFNNDFRYVYKTEKTITEEGLKNSSTKMLYRDDSIISARGTVGEMAMIPFPMAFNQSCYGLRAKRNIVDPTFLYYLVKYNVRILQKNTHGSVFDTITRDTFSGIDIDIPPIDAQRKIAGILRDLDDKIELNMKLNENLYEQLTSYYKHLFSAITPSTSVGELVDSIFSGGTPSTSNEAYWNGDHYWLSSGETSERFIVSTIKTITDAGASNSSTRKANKYDIVIASAGQGHTRGQTSMLLTDTYVNQSIIVVHAAPDYLPYLFWNIANRYEELRAISNSNSIRGSLTTKMIGSLSIPKADITQIRQFSDYAWPIVKAVENNLHENRRLAVMRDTLLPRLMSGELDVSALDL